MFRPIREVVIQGGGAINSKDYHNDNPQSKEKCQYIKLSFNYHTEAKNYLEFPLLQSLLLDILRTVCWLTEIFIQYLGES